jgi:hypothetical protein
MKPKRLLVIELLGDTSDEEEDVIIFETKKKKRPTSIVTARARQRMMHQVDSEALCEIERNSSVNISIAELKHRLAMRGIWSHGCIEK